MAVTAGTPFTAALITPGGIDGAVSVGARVEVPVSRAIASMFVPAVLDGSTWTVTLTAPLVAGDYQLVWMTGDNVPPAPFPIFVPLFVVATDAAAGLDSPVDYPEVDLALVTPDLADVVKYERTRTRDTDTGEDHGTFNDLTSPTAEEVDAIISGAVGLVLSQLRTTFDPVHYAQVKEAAALQTAVLIEASYFRNQAEETGGTAAVWRALYTTTILGLQNDIERDLNQALLLGVMEPRQPDRPWQRRLNF